MPPNLLEFIPPEAFKLLTVLFLSFLIGLEREEQKLIKGFAFGGVRTYPLIGLIGYSVAFLAQTQVLPVAIGLTTISGFLMLSYWQKVSTLKQTGLTSEMAGLTTYLIGALVYHGQYWIASSLAIASLLLLELKVFLEGLAQRFSTDDIITLTKFLFLTIVVLPILPNQNFSTFEINPFQTWLVMVAVSTISYGSFLLQRFIQGKQSIVLVALLGGAYSSTLTTVALAKQSSIDSQKTAIYTGGIIMASGVMYFRLLLLLSLFSRDLAKPLTYPFIFLGIGGIIAGLLVTFQAKTAPDSSTISHNSPPRNPLELKAAFSFAILFIMITVISGYVIQTFGRGGVFTLASIMGITDVDPFILSLSQSSRQTIPLTVAVMSIVIAAASNNIAKGFYALVFGDRRTGKSSLIALLGYSLIGLLPLLMLLPLSRLDIR